MTPADITRIRDAIYEGLLVRIGLVFTRDVCRERANNIAQGLIADIDDIVTAALKDAARGEVIVGEISGAQPHAPMDETTEELAKKLIR